MLILQPLVVSQFLFLSLDPASGPIPTPVTKTGTGGGYQGLRCKDILLISLWEVECITELEPHASMSNLSLNEHTSHNFFFQFPFIFGSWGNVIFSI